MKTIVGCAVGLALALMVSNAWAQAAPTPAQQAAAQVAILKRIDSALTGKSGLPRLTAPSDGPTLLAAFDHRTLKGRNLFDEEDGFDYCERTLVASQAYYTADTDVSLANIQSQTAEQKQGTAANADRYHDELALSFSYMLDCFGRLIEPAQGLWHDLTPSVRAQARDGVIMMRDGSLGMFQSTIEMMAEARYTLANKAGLLAALRRNETAYAAALTPTQRMRIRNSIDMATPRAPASLRSELTLLRNAFELKSCIGLCAA